MSDTGAIDKETSRQIAPATSARIPKRQSRELAYFLMDLISNESCGRSRVACFCNTLPMLLAAEPRTARPRAAAGGIWQFQHWSAARRDARRNAHR